ncbi:hypothetical protein G6F46_010870 [Rhizopus delemar]|uniref:Uncharacterized protein n=2 Tax=Rhizopus TaxID=4842 RepID=A0A9P7CM22_9FUNG|nr:hypothetical protein G6F43_007552 [Rhizopus delemar]KAG1138533.1 hypothetical protein G6F38_010492 [Rhizopus arrhizus]KAG1144023.1 hypothetical protein G6F37_012373 [Rhizopus arrhizus]KAG1450970.1 hypothetical protein G6F55_009422 [Rhizopus delemar]KAG1491656.1 hypothetical protein G6F54_009862 [Rhizopus delemar]
MTHCHIPYLSEDERLFLNSTATCSQARRMSNAEQNRASIEENRRQHHQSMSSGHHSFSSFFWKRRGSSTSSISFNGSVDYSIENNEPSPKAKELEMLIFEQPQRTLRLSLTPRCAA